jgi:hypothetical protein
MTHLAMFILLIWHHPVMVIVKAIKISASLVI